jgi:hypothetical protein
MVMNLTLTKNIGRSIRKGFVILALLLLSIALWAQNTISGTVTDANSGEVLIGATLYDPLSGRGYTTNSYGFFSISGATDSLELVVNYMGYEARRLRLPLANQPVSIALTPGVSEIESVVVTGHGSRARTHGHIALSRVDLKNTPVLMAEKDVLKTIQLLPGVQQNSEGTSNFSVRGGSHDQNLMLIDGIPVYNINHLWGFVSVFNTDAVNSVNFYKGGIPASYGGRLSSVVDVMLREGNPDRYTGSVSIGLISSKFAVEGPIQKGRSSFLLAGRRTMYDLVISPIFYMANDYMPGYYFQDYTLKLNHRVNPNNTIYLSSYLGNDKVYLIGRETDEDTDVEYKGRYDLGWSNITTALRWNNTSIPNVFSNVTVAHTHFRYLTSNRSWEKHPDPANNYSSYLGYYSGINDIIARWSVSYYGINNHQLNAGVENTWHAFNPGVSQDYTRGSTHEPDYTIEKGEYTYGQELNAYLDDRFSYGRVSGNVGIRYSLFNVGDSQYGGIQPRGLLEVEVSERLALFGGYNRMFQFLHLVSNSNLGMPTDLWLPSSPSIAPQQADQISIGSRYRVSKSMQVTVEAYTKTMKNVTDYRDGVVLRNRSEDWSQVLIQGNGSSRGVELMVEKNTGTISGWITYTLSKTDRTFSEIMLGTPFPFQYDRRHAANIFVSYKISPTKQLSTSWVVSTGHWMTVNYDNFIAGGFEYLNLTQRNNYRLWSFHHLDVSYTSSKEKKRGVRNWVFGVYNIYGNHNTFMIMRTEPNTNHYDPRKLYSVAIFPVVPFVAWEYVFK